MKTMKIFIYLSLAMSSLSTYAQCDFITENSTVIDIKNNLEWQACTFGMQWNKENGCTGEPTPLTLSTAFGEATKQGNGWRLPNIEELSLLSSNSCLKNDLFKSYFDIPQDNGEGASPYWSSTQIQSIPYLYYTFDMINHYIDGYTIEMTYPVRFVRDVMVDDDLIL
ncbi:TPA: DUF1566 domain-containing protein [Enterobacter cloacae]|nr:DUF1566 domain-containing protein [Enterobacter cloacae]HAS1177127.1 DUF1566 domain-containing protein [Enterobacter cloacae]